jgi:hypothetical protein
MSHAQRAAELWREVASTLPPGDDVFLGIRLTELIDVADSIDHFGWPEKTPVFLPILAADPGT